MRSFIFEELNPSTRDAVRSLILSGLEEHWGTLDESLNPDLDDMLASYATGHTVVARDAKGTIVGTGTLVPHGEAAAEIVRMSVDSSVRRSGIGRELADELVARARSWECESVVLETSTAWTDVIAFYLSCGFEITHVVDGDFGSDTWFALPLTQPDR